MIKLKNYVNINSIPELIIFIISLTIYFSIIIFYPPIFKTINSSFLSKINVSEMSSFLTILTTFYVGILSFLIPLTIQMISNIRKDFKVNEIEKRFKKDTPFEQLAVLLIISMFSIGIFFITRNIIIYYTSIYFLIPFYFIFTFIYILYLVYKTIKSIIKYSDKETVINILIDDSNNQLKNIDTSIKFKSLNSFKSLTDLLNNEISDEKPNHDIVSKLINEIKNILFELNKKNNTYSLAYNEDYSKYVTVIIDSIETLMLKSILTDSKLIGELRKFSSSIIEHLINLNDNYFLDGFLRIYTSLYELTLKNRNNSKYSFFYDWYFNFINQELYKYKNLNFLSSFDEILLSNIKNTINSNKIEEFEDFISYLHHSIGFMDIPINQYFYREKIKNNNYSKRDYLLNSKLRENLEKIVSIKRLNEFLINLKKIESQKKEYYQTEEEKEELNSLIDEYRKKAYEKLFFNNIKNMIWGTLVYSLYKNKHNFIRIVLTFNNPHDSEARWINHDIYPTEIRELINIMILNNELKNKFLFKEYHHEGKYYEKKLEIYLLGYLISLNKIIDSNILNKNYSTAQLDNFKYFITENLNKKVDETYNNENIINLKEIGFHNITEQKIKEINIKIKDLFIQLNDEIDNKIKSNIKKQKLSENKIKKFKEDIINKLKNYNSLKNFIKELDKNNYKKLNYKKENNFSGITTLLSREAFLEDTNRIFIELGSSLYHKIISIENEKIIKTIIKNCNKTDNNNLESVLKQVTELQDIIIISINSYHLEKNKFFKKTHKYDIASPYATLKYDNYEIPIYMFRDQELDESIIILNKNSIVNIRQYLASDKHNDENCIDSYFFEVKDLSNLDDSEIKKILNTDRDDLERFKENVFLKILENFDVTIGKNFQGYVFYPKKSLKGDS